MNILQGGENFKDALSSGSLSTNKPLNTGLVCGNIRLLCRKRPAKIREVSVNDRYRTLICWSAFTI